MTADDGTRLFLRHYPSQSAHASRTLIVVHGMSEHSDRYDHVAREIAGDGWNVVVPDLRGHGRSGGVPMHVRDFWQYNADLSLVCRHFGSPPERTALLGHSMGALVAARHVQLYSCAVSALVMLSPLLQVLVPIPKRTVALGKLVSFVAPRTRFRSRVDPANATRNVEALAQRTLDPLVHRSVTAGWYFAMKSALSSVWQEAGDIQLPVLVLQPALDRIVDPDAPKHWLKEIGCPDKSFRSYSEHYHELLYEPDWRETVATLVGWLGERVGTDDLDNRGVIA